MSDVELDDEAARWMVLHQAGAMTPAKRRAFNRWLSASSEALDAYRYAERVWRVAGSSRDGGGIAALRIGATSRPWWRLPRVRWAASGLAAGVAFLAAAVPVPIPDYLDTYFAFARGGGQEFSTEPIGRWTTKLADGTVVTLDGNTRMQVLEMGARRRIVLTAGHAFFKVAHDPAHPFLVTAMNKTVHAIGTAFDVRVAPNAVAVTLVEGKVRVDQSRGLFRAPLVADLAPGRQLVASDDEVWMMTRVNPARATAWLPGRLTFTGASVEEIARALNKGSLRKIVFDGPIDDRQRLAGSFAPGDVDTLATVLDFKGIAKLVSKSDSRIEMAPVIP